MRYLGSPPRSAAWSEIFIPMEKREIGRKEKRGSTKMTLPFSEMREITLNDDGELVHFDPGSLNESSRTSTIGVSVSDDWIQVGCTRVHRKAWERR